jgi:hypothetical protein
MANPQMHGPAGWPPSAGNAPAGTTRTTTGRGDHGDPTTTTAAGNTAGSSGINDHSDVNLPRLDDKAGSAPGAVVRDADGEPVALGGGAKAPIDVQTRKLAAIAYGEAGVKDVADEIGGMARAVANRARVGRQDHRSIADVHRHRVEILGAQVTIDHHAFPFVRAKAFPGEEAAEPGADARLFLGAHDVCVQGTAPSSSGTAQRHVHVVLVTDAFTPRARRHDLPSLFGSCLALARDARGGLRFLEGVYHTPAGAQESDGVVFKAWLLREGRFVKANDTLQIRFPVPGNVYRFSVVAP